jgi:molecular chaperone GrpE (heat shock protein)
MVLEDLIESMEDTQKQQEAMFDQMKKLAEREENAEIATLKSSEEALFKLLEAYHDQFHIFERASRSDPSWNRQFTLFRQIIATQLQASGISVIEQTGVPVNYALHEVIDSVPTDDPALNHHVAAIYDCGYIFRGTLKRKARISAYRCSVPSGQPEENDDSVI